MIFARLFRRTRANAPSRILFTNTLGGRRELFVPRKAGFATLYTCGPTVYSRQHIGNLRSGVFSDTVARVLAEGGYSVRRVINITDVGHLQGDGDEGADKVSEAAKKAEESPADIAERYAKLFVDDLAELGVAVGDVLFPRATEYIKEQILLAKTLEEKGFAYRIKDGLYFDTSRFPDYGKLGGVGSAILREGARVEKNPEKRHPADFALWRRAKKDDLQKWDSPWGEGNPGWHLECSAMARALLGIEVDIHTGGEDLAPVHHNNEIAESEAASGRPFVRYWLHNAFLTIEGEKISKSLQNDIYLSELAERGYHPLALRYFFLQAHYRSPLSFSWTALAGAAEALSRLWRQAATIGEISGRRGVGGGSERSFVQAMRDDLGSPEALGILWEALKSEEISPEEKWGLLTAAEAHLGLSLTEPPEGYAPLPIDQLPKDIRGLLSRRETARERKDFARADLLREEIERSGYRVEDTPEGAVLTRRTP